MSRWKRSMVAVLAVVGCGSIGLAGYSIPGETIMASADGVYDSAGAGVKFCGANCPSGWYTVGQCWNSQTCCGWVQCGSSGNSGQNTCCNSGQTCTDGRQCLPPCAPVCN